MPRPISSTYRLQLHAGFTFADASRVAVYLKELGVSHIYCSPYLQAAKGSQHAPESDVLLASRAMPQCIGGKVALPPDTVVVLRTPAPFGSSPQL
jgi:(1->4)-alpha-D-glucan 1-alpha-D-glucosylmutase